MREAGAEDSGHIKKRGKGRMDALLSQNKGIEGRAQRDLEALEVLNLSLPTAIAMTDRLCRKDTYTFEFKCGFCVSSMLDS